MTELPEVNSLVHVVISEDVDFRSRVEDVEGPLLTVAAPLDVLDLDLPPDQIDVEVFWTKERTRFVCPMRMIERKRDHVHSWRLVATGESRRCNRRQFVRAADGGPVIISSPTGERATSVRVPTDQPRRTGTIIDLGEGGVRCSVPPPVTVDDFQTGQDVLLSFTVAGQEIDVEGTVHSLRQGESNQGVDIVIEYALEERLAQVVRRHVMELQLIERRRQRAREDRQQVR